MSHILLWLSNAHHISFLFNLFSVKYRFLFPILLFFPQNHLALLKDRFLKKMLSKRALTRRSFLVKLYTIFALIDHSPVGRIHSEEWA